ncbi:MAG: hypothetical protein ACOX60_09700 [Massiliimalia sp.]|jgi:hypothetical protein
MKYKNLMALILTVVLTTTLFSGCGTQDGDSSAQGQTSVPVSQMSQPVSKEDSQTSQVDVLSSIREISPEEEKMAKQQGKLLGKEIKAKEEGGTLYLKGDHIKIYEAEIDAAVTAYRLEDPSKTEEEAKTEAVKNFTFREAFYWAAVQTDFSVDQQEMELYQYSALKPYTDPEEPFYPYYRIMLESTGLPLEQCLDHISQKTERQIIASGYYNKISIDWIQQWRAENGEDADYSSAWEAEEQRIIEEILEKDHVKIK